MTRRSPARLLAPLALVAVAAALFIVLAGRSGGGEPTSGRSTGARTTTTTPASRRPKATPAAQPSRSPRTYRVRAGDTPSQIAQETGVSVARLQELNPGLDAQSLTVGQRLKLR
jgi:LysM repeat protein